MVRQSAVKSMKTKGGCAVPAQSAHGRPRAAVRRQLRMRRRHDFSGSDLFETRRGEGDRSTRCPNQPGLHVTCPGSSLQRG